MTMRDWTQPVQKAPTKQDVRDFALDLEAIDAADLLRQLKGGGPAVFGQEDLDEIQEELNKVRSMKGVTEKQIARHILWFVGDPDGREIRVRTETRDPEEQALDKFIEDQSRTPTVPATRGAMAALRASHGLDPSATRTRITGTGPEAVEQRHEQSKLTARQRGAKRRTNLQLLNIIMPEMMGKWFESKQEAKASDETREAINTIRSTPSSKYQKMQVIDEIRVDMAKELLLRAGIDQADFNKVLSDIKREREGR